MRPSSTARIEGDSIFRQDHVIAEVVNQNAAALDSARRAIEVLTRGLKRANGRIADLEASELNEEWGQGTTVSDGTGPHPFDREFCGRDCRPVKDDQ